MNIRAINSRDCHNWNHFSWPYTFSVCKTEEMCAHVIWFERKGILAGGYTIERNDSRRKSHEIYVLCNSDSAVYPQSRIRAAQWTYEGRGWSSERALINAHFTRPRRERRDDHLKISSAEILLVVTAQRAPLAERRLYRLRKLERSFRKAQDRLLHINYEIRFESFSPKIIR